MDGSGFDHILEGYDIPTPAQTLKVSAKIAAEQFEDVPYSMLTNLAHAVMWQEFWLKKLAGGKRKSSMTEWQNDWRVPDPSEFEDLRKRFIEGLAEAKRISESEPFEHNLPSDEEATETILRIMVHGAYHLGQLNLLKRIARAKSRGSAAKG